MTYSTSCVAKTPVALGEARELREICHQWKKKQLTQADDGLENLDAWVQDLLEELQHVQCSEIFLHQFYSEIFFSMSRIWN